MEARSGTNMHIFRPVAIGAKDKSCFCSWALRILRLLGLSGMRHFERFGVWGAGGPTVGLPASVVFEGGVSIVRCVKPAPALPRRS